MGVLYFYVMKEIKLTQGYVALVDDDDYDELIKYKWHIQPSTKTFYVIRNDYSNGKHTTIRMHRQILNTIKTKIETDHIDGNGLNNQKSNLRTCTKQENCCNRSSRSDGVSKYVGISKHISRHGKQYWRARISSKIIRKSLGLFNTELEAAIARDKYIIDNNLSFFRLNLPQECKV